MPAVIVGMVDDLIGRGKSKSAAYSAVAKQQGLSAQTIAKLYRAEKKQG